MCIPDSGTVFIDGTVPRLCKRRQCYSTSTTQFVDLSDFCTELVEHPQGRQHIDIGSFLQRVGGPEVALSTKVSTFYILMCSWY